MYNNKDRTLLPMPSNLYKLLLSDASVCEYLEKALTDGNHAKTIEALIHKITLHKSKIDDGFEKGLLDLTQAIDRMSLWYSRWSKFSSRVYVNVLPIEASDKLYEQIKESFNPKIIQAIDVFLEVGPDFKVPLALNAAGHPFLNFKIKYDQYIQILAAHIFDLRVLKAKYPKHKKKLNHYERSSLKLLEVIKTKRREKKENTKFVLVKYLPCLLNDSTLYNDCKKWLDLGLLTYYQRFTFLNDLLIPLYIDFSKETNIMLSVDKRQLLFVTSKAVARLKKMASDFQAEKFNQKVQI